MSNLVETLYISASTNRHPHAATLAGSSTLTACQKFIGIWDPADPWNKGIKQTIPAHNAEVTCVKWVHPNKEFISADQNGQLKYWKKRDFDEWDDIAQIQAHTRPISALAVHDNLIVTGSSDSSLKLWHLGPNQDSLQPVQTIDMNGRFPLAIEVSYLPNSVSGVIMAIASTDRKIRIFTRSEEHMPFISSLSLEGHEDWVRCLAFQPRSEIKARENTSTADTLTLASGSQDGYIRLWAIAPILSSPANAPQEDGVVNEEKSDELMDAFERSLAEVDVDGDAAFEGGRQISNRAHVFSVGTGNSLQKYTLTFDALLVGHESGVTSLAWRPSPSPSPTATSASTNSSPITTLLSTSTDSSLILWSPISNSSASSVWTNRQRFGDVGGVKAGGFVGGLWNSEGDEVMGWTWNGGWRRWKQRTDASRSTEIWTEVGAITGHQSAVRSLSWAPNGKYIISASLDQTTRIHGTWKHSTENSSLKETWHEIARPQVHGYDLVGAVFLDPLRFVSVADEKVARVFDAPKGFVRTLKGLGEDDADTVNEAERPVGAVVPPLGLSNKAVTDEQEEIDATDSDASIYARPPFEGELSATTLWPEAEKLFGHGYELISIGASSTGSLVATACKSTTAEHAVVRVYDSKTWQPVGKPLEGHTLTVTRIAFSPDDQFILTVSRDRTWRLFEVQEDGGYVAVAHDKAHARIIWDCAWAAPDTFATAARDKTVKIWKRDASGKWSAISTLKLKESVTALDFITTGKRCRLAVGLETGEMVIFGSTTPTLNKWTVELTLDGRFAHVDQVHRLAWRPMMQGVGEYGLASCGEDRSLRVLRLNLPFE